MRKIIIVCLIICLSSCGSRKVQKSETKEEVKIETLETVKDSSVINVTIAEDSEEVIYTPIEANTLMLIEGKSYLNVVVKKSKKQAKTNLKEVKKKKATKAKVTAIKKEVAIKEVERKESYSWILWLILLNIIFYIILYLIFKFRN